MRSVCFSIVFLVFSQVGSAQITDLKKDGGEKKTSDTISINGNVFQIVLPPKYNSKLFPKILGNKIALVNAKGEVQCLIRNYYCGFNDHGRYREVAIIDASIDIGLFPKDTSSFWITNVNGWGEFGKEKPIIDGFKMERVK